MGINRFEVQRFCTKKNLVAKGAIIKLLKTVGYDEFLSSLPLWESQFPKIMQIADTRLRVLDEIGLRDLLSMDPNGRPQAQVCLSRLENFPRPHACRLFKKFRGSRGPSTIMHGHIGHDVLDWVLQCQELKQMLDTARDPAENKHFEHLDNGQLCKAEVFFKAGFSQNEITAGEFFLVFVGSEKDSQADCESRPN